MEDFDSDSKEAKTSKYNSAGDQLKRIGNVWEVMHREVRNGNFFQWNINLDRIWAELAGDLDPNSSEEKALIEINELIVELYPLASSNLPSFNKKPDGYYIRLGKQYQILVKKELILRRLQNKLGKGTAWSDPYEDDF